LTILFWTKLWSSIAVWRQAKPCACIFRRQNVVLYNACDRGFAVQVTLIFTVL